MMQNNWKGYIMKCKKNKLIKKVFIIFSALIFLIILLWTIMQINTNSVLEDVENAIYCKDYYIPNNLKESNEMKKIKMLTLYFTMKMNMKLVYMLV